MKAALEWREGGGVSGKTNMDLGGEADGNEGLLGLRLEEYADLEASSCAELADDDGGDGCEEEGCEGGVVRSCGSGCASGERGNTPMDIERPPTKAKSMGLAPGNVSEFR